MYAISLKHARCHPVAAGFSLLEVMVAVTIMGIVMGALIVTFRTGIRGWRMGHRTSEVFQTARITRDVMLRDLHNLTFLEETRYNRSFRQHFETMMQAPYRQVQERARTRSRRDDDGQVSPLELLNLSTMAPPIDLSFRVEDGGALDRLSFVRWQRPGPHSPNEVWGLRRLTYFVEDGVLYRQEADPFGFHPSELVHQISMQSEEYRKMFMHLPNDERQSHRMWGLPPNLQLNVEEPLCEGIEIFDLSMGYFQGGQWVEVDDWDSSARRYRHPPEQEELEPFQNLIQRDRDRPQENLFSVLMQSQIV